MAYTTFRPSADGSLVINESAGRRTAEEISQHAKRLMKKTLERAARSGVEEAFGNAIVENRNQPGFSYQTMIEGIRARGLSETITTTSVYSSLDVATQQDVFDDYAAYPAIYESIAEIQQSNSDEELYPEDWTDDLPAQVSELEEAPQARISGIEYRIRNHTYARMLSISKDAFDNDQRGRIKRRASQFAQNYKKVIDRTFIYTMFRQLTTSNTFMPSTNILGQN
jgi:hypothetical protein